MRPTEPSGSSSPVDVPPWREGRGGTLYTVYILQSTLNGRYYVGSTNNLGRRVREHNRGQTQSTRFGKQWRVIRTEQLPTRSDAIRREQQIKAYKGGNAFRKLIGTERE